MTHSRCLGTGRCCISMISPSFGTIQVAVLSDSKVTRDEGKCEGLEQGKTWDRKWQEMGSRAAPV